MQDYGHTPQWAGPTVERTMRNGKRIYLGVQGLAGGTGPSAWLVGLRPGRTPRRQRESAAPLDASEHCGGPAAAPVLLPVTVTQPAPAATPAPMEQGSKRTSEARERMQRALSSIAKVRTALDEISTAAREQQQGIAQINEGVNQIDGITQQNAALVEELAAAAQSLQGRALGVSNSMRLFRLVRGEQSLSEVDAMALRRSSRQELVS